MSHLTNEEIASLKEKAKQVRIDILKMITKANSGHTGGSLSVADLLTLLYFREMNVDPKDPHKADRDRLVLSKGHAAPAMYACLAEKGYFPMEELNHLRQAGHMLQGHPDMKHTPGVDMTTGSLGQGISAACGMALASKIDNASWRVYAVLGMGNWKRARYGKLPCMQPTTNWTISPPLWITTASRSTDRLRKSCLPCRSVKNSKPSAGMSSK